ncbi:transposase [Natronobacillus azotifigens]|uniref:IS66 family transposase n=1 Tax=Natronobacillus azotifigens TaxID=472978 RepID=A0A9J6RGP8_9BACI|nr:IS66 family transposase [Natronobacillus azotifigens]MCZ0704622.1 IS66 family transposase [Natronobacillus azotifigens]
MTELEKKLTRENEELTKKIEVLTEQVNFLISKIYNPSSEKTPPHDEDQLALFTDDDLNIFNEVETASDPDAIEPDCLETITYKRKKGTKQSKIIKELPIEEVDCYLEEGCQCEWCETVLRPIGREFVREEVEFIPATLKRMRYYRHAYECPTCKEDGEDVIVKAPTPKPVIQKSLASPSSVAWLLHQKYEQFMPFHRQEKEWQRYGIDLSRTTMANWAVNVSQNWLTPLYEALHKELLKENILFADETTAQVLREKDRKPRSKSYMWLYRTGPHTERQIVLYEYQTTRAAKHPKAFLANFRGFLHCDGYDGYNSIPNVTRVGCLAHVRRKFHEAIPKGEQSKTASAAKVGRSYCDQLFKLEEKWQNLSGEERLKKRKEESLPLFEEFFTWVSQMHVLKQSLLGKALIYAKNQKAYLMNVLLDGNLHVSNNLAERSIRPLVVGRKAWYFSTSSNGARSSAVIFSIIQTAKDNGLDPFKYLTYLFEKMPNRENPAISMNMKDFFPWQTEIQEQCK